MQNDSLQRQDIDIKILTGEEILDIYTTHSIRHFPEDERKPVSSIQRMTAEGIYTGYGLYSRMESAPFFFNISNPLSGISLDF